MDQIKIGHFIAGCRKEKGLTQVQLADKLNITDRAVSKWETGKSLPDSSIMLELCDILGISVNELLSGERIEMERYEEKVTENLVALKKNDEHSKEFVKKILVVAYSASALLAIAICGICEFATTKELSWSLIVGISVAFGYILTCPFLIFGQKWIRNELLSLSILIIPFLMGIRLITSESNVTKIGIPMSIIGIIFMWIVFFVFQKLHAKKCLASGFSFLIAIPFMLVVNATLSYMTGETIIDYWDILSAIILLLIGVCLIALSHKVQQPVESL